MLTIADGAVDSSIVVACFPFSRVVSHPTLSTLQRRRVFIFLIQLIIVFCPVHALFVFSYQVMVGPATLCGSTRLPLTVAISRMIRYFLYY